MLNFLYKEGSFDLYIHLDSINFYYTHSYYDLALFNYFIYQYILELVVCSFVLETLAEWSYSFMEEGQRQIFNFYIDLFFSFKKNEIDPYNNNKEILLKYYYSIRNKKNPLFLSNIKKFFLN